MIIRTANVVQIMEPYTRTYSVRATQLSLEFDLQDNNKTPSTSLHSTAPFYCSGAPSVASRSSGLRSAHSHQ